jgi:hypothetical protein
MIDIQYTKGDPKVELSQKNSSSSLMSKSARSFVFKLFQLSEYYLNILTAFVC